MMSINTLGGDRGDEDTNGSSDQRRGISHGRETLRLDEVRHLLGESVEMGLDVVFQDEAGQGAGGLVLVGHLGQHEDEVRVEVGEAVELLQLLLHLALDLRVGRLRLAEQLEDLGQALLLRPPIHAGGGGGGGTAGGLEGCVIRWGGRPGRGWRGRRVTGGWRDVGWVVSWVEWRVLGTLMPAFPVPGSLDRLSWSRFVPLQCCQVFTEPGCQNLKIWVPKDAKFSGAHFQPHHSTPGAFYCIFINKQN